MPVLDYQTPEQRHARVWQGGLARGIVKIAATIAVLASFMPSHVGSGIIRANRVAFSRLGCWSRSGHGMSLTACSRRQTGA